MYLSTSTSTNYPIPEYTYTLPVLMDPPAVQLEEALLREAACLPCHRYYRGKIKLTLTD